MAWRSHPWLRRVWAPVLCAGVVLGVARTAWSHDPASKVCVEARPAHFEAVAFELEQGGLGEAVVGHERCDATITITYGERAWTLVHKRVGSEVEVRAGSQPGSSPELLALQAAELMHAASLSEVTEPTALERSDPVVSPAELNEPPQAELEPPANPGLSTRVTPPSAPTKRGFELEVSASTASFGVAGAALGLRHRWTRAEFGVVVEGAYLAHSHEDVMADGDRSVVDPGGVLRIRAAPAYVFLPKRRVRPSLGLSNELVVPLVPNRRTSTGTGASDSFVDVNEVGAGLMWVPTLELGLRVDVRPDFGFLASIRTGPSVTLREVELVGGASMDLPAWFVAGNAGLTFGPGRRR